MRNRLQCCLAGGLALVAWLPGAGTAAAGPIEPLQASGRWITDAGGRVVVFHGVNIVPPGPEPPAGARPQAPPTPAAFGIGDDDLRFLRRQGFRLIRLGAFYASVEPERGRYDRSFLEALGDYQRRIAQRGIFTLFDIHQDLYARSLRGRGFPEWMVQTDGLPLEPNPGFPAGYLTSPAANRAYDNFWANAPAGDGAGLVDHFAGGWARIVRRLARSPRVLGYDVLNEPWPGSQWPPCANPFGCPPGGFDQTVLTDFFRRLADVVRRVDRHRIVFAEPNLQFDVGAATGLGPIGDPNAGLSFHDYCIGAAPGLPGLPDPLGLCRIGEQLVIDNAERYARRAKAALLLTEFSDMKDPAVSRRVTDLADRSMLGWTHWSYFAGAGQIIKDPTRPPAPWNLERGLLDAVVRPYPYLIAGTPLGFHYDRAARTLALEYLARPLRRLSRATASPVTEIVVPRRAYPHGHYRVRVAGGRVVSPPRAPTLRLRNLPGAARVRVVVRPGR